MLSGFELYPRWVPLKYVSCPQVTLAVTCCALYMCFASIVFNSVLLDF